MRLPQAFEKYVFSYLSDLAATVSALLLALRRSLAAI
jgi:hypothetical protein